MNPYETPKTTALELTEEVSQTFVKNEDGSVQLKPNFKQVKKVQIIKSTLYSLLLIFFFTNF